MMKGFDSGLQPETIVDSIEENISTLKITESRIKDRKKYEKRNFSLEEFEKILSRYFNFEKINDSCYIINKTGNGEKIIPQKSFGLIPYCLKPLNCMHRLGYDCHNFDQEVCKNCNARKLIEFYETRRIPYYHIVQDDEDVPKAIKTHKERYGDFEAVIAVSCPRAVLENKRFIQQYKDVSVIFVSLTGWNDCNIKKALEGKWWGETTLDISGLREACNECLSSSPSTLQLEK